MKQKCKGSDEVNKVNALIEFKNVTYFSPTSALPLILDVSHCFYENNISTIIGPNGAGKTTFIKLMLNLLQPNRGSIQKKEGLKVGYMPQRLVLDETFPLTVKRFLQLTFLQSGQDNLENVKNVLKQVSLSKSINKSIHRLSGGEWQRVLLARALLSEPDLLILDEPVQCLDHNGQQEFYELLKSISKQQKCTVIQVSHDLHLVWDASDEIICLNKHICCSGSPEQVKKSKSFQSLFSGFVPYVHHHNHRHFDHDHSECKQTGDLCSNS